MCLCFSPVHCDLANEQALILLYCTTDRDMLKLTQEEFERVPAQIIVEVLLAAVLCMWGENPPGRMILPSAFLPGLLLFSYIAYGYGNNMCAGVAGSLQLAGSFKPISALANQE